MAKLPARILCIFCEQWGKPSREDVFPKWLARELGGKEPFKADLASFRSGQLVKSRSWKVGSISAFKVPKVCRECNNVWLSQWEEDAKPVLLRMIYGNDTRLDREERDIVSTWAFKTALTYDAYYDLRLMPPEIGPPAFYQEDKPLAATRVLIGAYDAPPEGVLILHARNAPHLVDFTAGSVIERPIRFTFVFKYLLVRVLADERVNRPLQSLGPADADLLECWPINDRVLTWPPASAWDYEAVRKNA